MPMIVPIWDSNKSGEAFSVVKCVVLSYWCPMEHQRSQHDSDIQAKCGD